MKQNKIKLPDDGKRNVDYQISGMDQEELYRTYAPAARLVCQRILYPLGTKEDVEEVVQDVMCELLTCPEKYDECRASFKTYVAVVARSRALNMVKKLSRLKMVPMEGVLEIGLEDNRAVEWEELKDLIKQILKSLKPKEQKLFSMRFLYHMTIEEIAEQSGSSRAAVDIRISRLRKKLEKIFSEEGITIRENRKQEV
ncbi:hypothetical protein C0033_10745 [Clostridium sp. chh4-2]|uniref:RNA polymerase sigma factor n=1 Tax=Clostridium sp. chh4-2 TaxID=2067550 RepID=UPI000CCFC57E|nr:sigma-70 family RNA polymerase sigma factor [Clostridium sp. chh4-2]PNV62122.1 hypothetical protein C0033_10745 [Clostridium sp. chh4-2]